MATSPLALGLGVLAIGYGRRLQRLARDAPRETATPERPNRVAVVLAGGVVTLSLFWATSSFAGAYGRGQAVELAERLTADLPAVVLDTTEKLYARYPGVEESQLPSAAGQQFLYRYRGFRLLIESKGRLFLLPEQWQKADGATLVVGVGDDLRLQLYE